MSYNLIVNPANGKRVSIYNKRGQNIIQGYFNYLIKNEKNQLGGAATAENTGGVGEDLYTQQKVAQQEVDRKQADAEKAVNQAAANAEQAERNTALAKDALEAQEKQDEQVTKAQAAADKTRNDAAADAQKEKHAQLKTNLQIAKASQEDATQQAEQIKKWRTEMEAKQNQVKALNVEIATLESKINGSHK